MAEWHWTWGALESSDDEPDEDVHTDAVTPPHDEYRWWTLTDEQAEYVRRCRRDGHSWRATATLFAERFGYTDREWYSPGGSNQLVGIALTKSAGMARQ